MGLPIAVESASHIRASPPFTSHEPGSSQMAKGVFTNPIAVFPLRANDPQPSIRVGVSDAASCDRIQESVSAPGLKILSHEPVNDPSLFDACSK